MTTKLNRITTESVTLQEARTLLGITQSTLNSYVTRGLLQLTSDSVRYNKRVLIKSVLELQIKLDQNRKKRGFDRVYMSKINQMKVIKRESEMYKQSKPVSSFENRRAHISEVLFNASMKAQRRCRASGSALQNMRPLREGHTSCKSCCSYLENRCSVRIFIDRGQDYSKRCRDYCNKA